MDAGRRRYASIIGNFIERERSMPPALDPAERRQLVRLFGKIIAAADA